MLGGGTSTLFAAHRLTDFSMSLQNAVYYNSIGEVFLARNVEVATNTPLPRLRRPTRRRLPR